MITRVTVTLDSTDVELLDRLARTQGLNRSEQMRQILAEMRPVIRQTVETLEAALRQRDEFLELVAEAEATGLNELLPEIHRIQGAVLGAMSRIEGALAVRAAADPRPSNHGGHTPTPPPMQSTE